MTQLPERLSPVHDALEHLHPRWGEIEGMPVPLDFGDPQAEADRAKTLALCDVSALARLTLKGPNTRSFLSGRGIGIPEEIYLALPLSAGGMIVKTGSTEFFLEEGCGGDTLSRLDRDLGAGGAGVYRAVRQDASFLLTGSQATEVLAQTCGYDFRKPGPQMAMTRIAGVSCSVLLRDLNGFSLFQTWLDCSFGLYLWETLLAVVRELGGEVAGMACFFPALAREER